MYLYQNIKDELLKYITINGYDVGDKILSERSLAKIFKCSRTTIKNALDKLIDEDILYKKHGSGTFLKRHFHSSSIIIGDDSPSSLNQSILLSGRDPLSLVSSFKLTTSDDLDFKKVTDVFSLKYNEFYELKRYRIGNKENISFQVAYIPFREFEDAHRYDFSDISLYDYMDSKGMRPINFNKKITAELATEETKFLLDNPAERYLLCVHYLGYTKENMLVEYTTSFFNPNKIEFSITTPYTK